MSVQPTGGYVQISWPSRFTNVAPQASTNWVKERWPKLEDEVVNRSDDVKGFAVLPKRWIVERTFGWVIRHRRMVRDYERTESSAEAWFHLAMIRIQLRRLA